MDCWIAVVDDEALSLANAKSLLGNENMRVSCLRSGRDLMKFLEKNEPDLILLDILMPDMDGFETYNALRSFEDKTGRSHIPVIFLTGANDCNVERRGLKAGASDFIHKPFNKDILLSRIDNTVTNSRTIESLTEEATIDKLTGFLNKASGTKRIAGLCSENTGALMIMDLDNFKLVNDLFGHDMGDRVLKAFSDILRHNIRESDVISRIGGDEFLGFFSDMTDGPAVKSLSDRLNRQLMEKAADLMGEEHGIPLGISLGAVMVPEYGRDYESLFALADNSLYVVKQNGKHGYYIYAGTESMDDGEAGSLTKEIEKITKIVEERNDMSGALLLGREAFSIAYRFIMRFYKRYGGTFVKVLFDISSADETKSRFLYEASEQFGNLLQKSLRRSDIVMQNRSNQYFVILNERTAFDAEKVIQRIKSLWDGTEYHTKINLNYSFAYEECLKGKKGEEIEAD